MRTKSNAAQNYAPGIKISAPWRIFKVKVLSNFCLEVVFMDGLSGSIDMSHYIKNPSAGVFAQLRDEKVFKKAYLEHGVVTWPGDIDLAPDVMYEQIRKHGQWVLSF